MLAIPLSIVLYLKVEALAGSEIVALVAAVAFYLVLFFLLALFFNSRAKGEGKATSTLDALLEGQKSKAELAREKILRQQKEIEKRNSEQAKDKSE